MNHQSVAVLLVEDDAAAARLLRTLVVEAELSTDFRFTLSPSLPDALGRLTSDVFDVVLLTWRCRASPAWKGSPPSASRRHRHP